MATIAEQLTELQAVKSGLKTALTADGSDMSAVPFTDYPGKVQAMSERWRSLLDGSITEIDFAGVTNVKSGACMACTNLTKVSLPEGILRINTSAFQQCSSLTDFVIPDSVKTLGNSCFRDCHNLKRLVVGKNAGIGGTISTFAFHIGSSECQATIIMRPTTPPQIASSTIGPYVSRIVVPWESSGAYATATNWAAVADRLEYRLEASIIGESVDHVSDILDGDVSKYPYRAKYTGSDGIKQYLYTDSAEISAGSVISYDSGTITFESNPDAEGVSA